MSRQPPEPKQDGAEGAISPGETAIPLAHEQVTFSTEKVTEGRVTVTRKTVEKQQSIEEQLVHEQIEVRHIAKGTPVDSIPPIREEDGVTIIPVVEEQIEVIRRLVLKEEIHIIKKTESTPFKDVVTLKHQEVVIDRQDDKS